MSGFVKLYGSIIRSTVWQQPPATKLVWLTMLVLADAQGVVESSIPGLASTAGVSIEETEAALLCFMSPDKYSQTKTDEGRRVKQLDSGWLIINHGKYRELRTDKQIRDAERIKLHRATRSNVATDPDPDPDPNSDPDQILDLCSAQPVAAVAATKPKREKRGKLWHFVPKEWEPTDAHREKVKGTRVVFEEELSAFRSHEFNVAKSDASLAFHRWLTTAVKQARGAPQVAPGSTRSFGASRWEPQGVEPRWDRRYLESGPRGFCQRNGLDIEAEATKFVATGQPQQLTKVEADGAFRKQLIDSAKKKATEK